MRMPALPHSFQDDIEAYLSLQRVLQMEAFTRRKDAEKNLQRVQQVSDGHLNQEKQLLAQINDHEAAKSRADALRDLHTSLAGSQHLQVARQWIEESSAHNANRTYQF